MVQPSGGARPAPTFSRAIFPSRAPSPSPFAPLPRRDCGWDSDSARAPGPRFQKQHFVNDGNFVLQLNLHQRAADRLADVRRMDRFAAQNHAETNDGGK